MKKTNEVKALISLLVLLFFSGCSNPVEVEDQLRRVPHNRINITVKTQSGFKIGESNLTIYSTDTPTQMTSSFSSSESFSDKIITVTHLSNYSDTKTISIRLEQTGQTYSDATNNNHATENFLSPKGKYLLFWIEIKNKINGKKSD